MELDEAQNRVKEQQIVIDRLTEEIDRLTEDVEDQKILIENLRKDRSSAVRERSRVQDNGRCRIIVMKRTLCAFVSRDSVFKYL